MFSIVLGFMFDFTTAFTPHEEHARCHLYVINYLHSNDGINEEQHGNE